MRGWFRKTQVVIVAIALTVMPFVNPPEVHAGGVFATEITQILNHIELIQQYVEQVQMVANDLLRYQEMLKQGVLDINQIFGPIQQDLNLLGQTVQGGQSLAYSLGNLDGQFQQRFPGYQPSTNFSLQYKNWSQTSLDSIMGLLRSIGLQGRQLNNEQTILNALRQKSQSAAGRMQAIEIGTQISEEQVEQLMKLRQLMLADMESKAAYQGYMLQQDATNKANVDSFFGSSKQTSDGVPF